MMENCTNSYNEYRHILQKSPKILGLLPAAMRREEVRRRGRTGAGQEKREIHTKGKLLYREEKSVHFQKNSGTNLSEERYKPRKSADLVTFTS